MTQRFPHVRQVVLDCTDPRALAEFYRSLLGFDYRPGDETVGSGGDDWVVIRDDAGRTLLAFQRVEVLPTVTWPAGDVPQQLHLDLTVPTMADLEEQTARVTALGGRLLLDASDDEEEPLRVFADPAGHPFCVFVSATP